MPSLWFYLLHSRWQRIFSIHLVFSCFEPFQTFLLCQKVASTGLLFVAFSNMRMSIVVPAIFQTPPAKFAGTRAAIKGKASFKVDKSLLASRATKCQDFVNYLEPQVVWGHGFHFVFFTGHVLVRSFAAQTKGLIAGGTSTRTFLLSCRLCENTIARWCKTKLKIIWIPANMIRNRMAKQTLKLVRFKIIFQR